MQVGHAVLYLLVTNILGREGDWALHGEDAQDLEQV